jgi:DNA-binding beta-propeller fold protein YncE
MSKALKILSDRYCINIVFLTVFLSTVASATSNPKIYWNVKETVHFGRCNLDGSNVEALSVPGATDLRRFALHPRRGRIYWADTSEGILQTKMAGSARIIISSVPTGSIRGLAVDPNMGKIYWVDFDKIQRANIDGSHTETLYTLDIGLEGLAVDLQNRNIYVTNWANGKILRAAMDGVITIFTGHIRAEV